MRSHATPFERLRETFDDGEFRCEACGFTDRDGRWRVTAVGKQVQYKHVCPKCDAVQRRELRL